MGLEILKYIVSLIIPVILSFVLFSLSKYTKFGKLKKIHRDIIVCSIFCVALLLSSLIPINFNNIYITPYEVYPVIVGLVFSGPLAIIVGLVGGLFRFLSSLWNPSLVAFQYVYLITAIFSGLFTAFIKKFVLSNRRGEWYHGLLSLITVESLFMILVFAVDSRNTKSAFDIVISIIPPILIGSSASIIVCLLTISIIAKDKLFYIPKKLKLTSKIQISLFSCLIVAYALVSGFAFLSVYDNARSSINHELTTSVDDLKNDVYRKVNDYIEEKVIFATDYTDTYISLCEDPFFC